jgi:molecular chaperone HscB
VSPPPSDGPGGRDPFATLGLEPRFDIDPAAIRAAFRGRAAGCHPDRAGAGSHRAGLARISAELAEAQRILLDPVLRGEALLESLGGRVASGPPSGEFLVEMMEIREAIDSMAGDRAGLDSIRADLEDRIRETRDRLAVTFEELAGREPAARAAGFRMAADMLGTLRYLDRLSGAARAASDEADEVAS